MSTSAFSRGRSYQYDKLGRLKEARGGNDPFNNPAWTQSYSYDRYGNRTGVTKSGPNAGSVPLDGLASLGFTNGQGQTTSNRITTAGYEYDPAGNVTRGQTDNGVWLRYKYDSAGRLAQVLDDGSAAQETYSYGASNQRLKTVYGNGLGAPATYYGWDGGQVISEYRDGISSNLTWEKHYVYLGGRLLATTDSSGTKYHHPDRLGTRLVTDGASGAILTEQLNLPFGTAFTGESSGATNNRRFTSYDRSGTTGMDYAVNRFYSATQGRFTQVDPIGMSATRLSDPQTLNLYAYCENDPINHIDPDGLFIKKLFGWVGKAVKWAYRVAAVLVAVVAVIALGSLGQYWGGILITKWVVTSLFASSALLATAGWAPGALGQIAGAFLTTLGKGSNFKTPGINGAAGLGAVSSFLQPNSNRSLPPFYGIIRRLAVLAIRAVNARSRIEQREYGGEICRDASGHIYSTPARGGSLASFPPLPCPGGDLRVGQWHTHGANVDGYDNEHFSGVFGGDRGDIPLAERNAVPLFLGTPSRRIRVFIPDSSIYEGPGITGGRFITFKERTP
jgi:RHS repeat-associated protein